MCYVHGQDVITGNDVIHIKVNMLGRLLRQTRRVGADVDTEPDISGADYLNCENHLNPDSDDDDVDPRVLAPIGIDDFFVEPEALPPTHSRRDMVPIYDVNRQVPSHVIWNSQ